MRLKSLPFPPGLSRKKIAVQLQFNKPQNIQFKTQDWYQEMQSQESSSQETLSQDISSESQDIASQEIQSQLASQEIQSEDIASQEIQSQDISSQEVQSQETLTGLTLIKKTTEFWKNKTQEQIQYFFSQNNLFYIPVCSLKAFF